MCVCCDEVSRGLSEVRRGFDQAKGQPANEDAAFTIESDNEFGQLTKYTMQGRQVVSCENSRARGLGEKVDLENNVPGVGLRFVQGGGLGERSSLADKCHRANLLARVYIGGGGGEEEQQLRQREDLALGVDWGLDWWCGGAVG